MSGYVTVQTLHSVLFWDFHALAIEYLETYIDRLSQFMFHRLVFPTIFDTSGLPQVIILLAFLAIQILHEVAKKILNNSLKCIP